MRWVSLFSIVLAAFASGCGSRGGSGNRDRIELGKNVTVSGKPLDPVFKNFPQSWRQFISTNPDLAVPVTGVATRQEPTSQQPIIISECVFSPDAQGYVPQVTLSWDEPSGSSVAARKQQQNAPGQSEQIPVRRFDLGLHHDAFGRNFYSSAMSTDKLKRFYLPPNSALVNNQEAVLLTGAGLFPKLMDYRTLTVRDSSSTTNRQFLKQTVVLRELSEGITNTMRVSHLVGRAWKTDQQFVFLVPVCPTGL
jgi:hypothetical protein